MIKSRSVSFSMFSIDFPLWSERRWLITDRIAMIYGGKIIWSGPVSALDHVENPYVDQFIHGRADGPIQMELRA